MGEDSGAEHLMKLLRGPRLSVSEQQALLSVVRCRKALRDR